MRILSLLSIPLFGLISCNSIGTERHLEIEPLESFENIELAYDGAVSSRGLPGIPLLENDQLDGEVVQIECQVFEIDRDSAAQVIGPEQFYLRADRVDRDAAQRLFDELGAEGAHDLALNPILSLHRGGQGHITVTNQTAYVESFEIRTQGAATIGDPVIGVAHDGLLMEIEAKPGEFGSPLEFHFQLSMAQLQRPIQETTSRMPGLHIPMTIQTPIYATQRIGLDTTLGSSEALLVGPLPAFDGDRPLLILITAEPQPLQASPWGTKVQE